MQISVLKSAILWIQRAEEDMIAVWGGHMTFYKTSTVVCGVGEVELAELILCTEARPIGADLLPKSAQI